MSSGQALAEQGSEVAVAAVTAAATNRVHTPHAGTTSTARGWRWWSRLCGTRACASRRRGYGRKHGAPTHSATPSHRLEAPSHSNPSLTLCENRVDELLMHRSLSLRSGLSVFYDFASDAHHPHPSTANYRRTFGKRLVEHAVIRAKFAEMARQVEATQAATELLTYQLKVLPREQARSFGRSLALHRTTRLHLMKAGTRRLSLRILATPERPIFLLPGFLTGNEAPWR